MPSYCILFGTALLMFLSFGCRPKPDSVSDSEGKAPEYYREKYRPQFHFSPEAQWMNDPNGLVYHRGMYHLFYQYYPDSTVWGPMHWGHAISSDLISWEHRPIALYPDEYGYIFSGSAVLDTLNTSGLGTERNPPLVAAFTYHDSQGEKLGRTDFQTQGIAYSLDDGETWTKYRGNPVIKNPGIRDFRDPKVFWNEDTAEWNLILVGGDHMQVWGSPDLKSWEYHSDFGQGRGNHDGVWECPDLFALPVAGTDTEKWVLLISVNPGAPNGGSGTQYFVGEFDGKKFVTDQSAAKWVDWGTDNYAGVTYNNAPDEARIFIGWMSNWEYATKTPATVWRSAMTIPRKLTLALGKSGVDLYNYPVEQLANYLETWTPEWAKQDDGSLSTSIPASCDIRFTATSDLRVVLSNGMDEAVELKLDRNDQIFSLDRSRAGEAGFSPGFARSMAMPVPDLPNRFEVRILVDASSVEVFLNQGQYAMTAQVFPNAFYDKLQIGPLTGNGREGFRIIETQVLSVRRIWKGD